MVILSVRQGCEAASPGDVAVAGGVESIAAFTEDPTGSLETFAQGKEIGGDVLIVFGKAFLGGGELVHEGETDVMLFAGEVYGGKFTSETLGGVPTDLAAEAGGVATNLKVSKTADELEDDGAEEMPIVGSTSEEAAEPEVVSPDFINVKDSEVALTAGSDIEAGAKARG
jgi:hypothetical protein